MAFITRFRSFAALALLFLLAGPAVLAQPGDGAQPGDTEPQTEDADANLRRGRDNNNNGNNDNNNDNDNFVGVLTLPGAAPNPADVDDTAVRARLTQLFTQNGNDLSEARALRLSFHDAGTHVVATGTGGVDGSIRYPEEAFRDQNRGLWGTIQLLEAVKEDFPAVSYADIYQLAGVMAVERAGGPSIPFVYGRQDVCPENIPEPDLLPDARQGTVEHLRGIFGRMGFTDTEIVALSGAHALGRARRGNSGFNGAFTNNPNDFTNEYFVNLVARAEGGDPDVLQLPTDRALLLEPFLTDVRRYASSQATFFAEYSAAHEKMSRLGAVWAPQAVPACTTTVEDIAAGLGMDLDGDNDNNGGNNDNDDRNGRNNNDDDDDDRNGRNNDMNDDGDFDFDLPGAAPNPADVDDTAVRARLTQLFTQNGNDLSEARALRLSFHDAGTHVVATGTGGVDGSIRYPEEAFRDQNRGLWGTIQLLEAVKEDFPAVSYADIYQLAGVMAVERAGGPSIPFVFGRQDVCPENIPEPDLLPDARQGTVEHLRGIFGRMGFTDTEIVALSGAHALGRARRGNSGFNGAFTNNPNDFTNEYFVNLVARAEGGDPDVLQLPTDRALLLEPFLTDVRRYASSQATFFAEYSAAHEKMSRLGAVWAPQAVPACTTTLPPTDAPVPAVATPTAAPTTPSPTPALDTNGEDLGTPVNLGSEAPTPAPTVASTSAPTVAATSAPTVASTSAPTVAATSAPTVAATPAPTATATSAPTVAATSAPTVTATPAPTVAATSSPVASPTDAPVPASTSSTSGEIVVLAFDMTFSDVQLSDVASSLSAQSAFIASYTDAVAAEAGVPASAVTVTSLQAGSVVVKSEVAFGTSAPAAAEAQADTFQAVLLDTEATASIFAASPERFGSAIAATGISRTSASGGTVVVLPPASSPSPSPSPAASPPPPALQGAAAPPAGVVVNPTEPSPGGGNNTVYIGAGAGVGVAIACVASLLYRKRRADRAEDSASASGSHGNGDVFLTIGDHPVSSPGDPPVKPMGGAMPYRAGPGPVSEGVVTLNAVTPVGPHFAGEIGPDEEDRLYLASGGASTSAAGAVMMAQAMGATEQGGGMDLEAPARRPGPVRSAWS